jgi:3-methyladenine DNA glycosylase AlkD
MIDPRVDFVRQRLMALADPERARQQQAYLKTTQPMFGVSRPDQRAIDKQLVAAHPPVDRGDWEAGVRALWSQPERDLQYAAIGYARALSRRRFLVPQTMPLLEQMVREGAWWDLVDEIAAHLVGEVVLRHREAVRPVLQRWIDDDDVWVRRTALLAQLRHKGDTDVEQLFDFCSRQAHDDSFWIRKAIGWALRTHARIDPDAVRAFLAEQGDRLSGLSRREASKHL